MFWNPFEVIFTFLISYNFYDLNVGREKRFLCGDWRKKVVDEFIKSYLKKRELYITLKAFLEAKFEVLTSSNVFKKVRK